MATLDPKRRNEFSFPLTQYFQIAFTVLHGVRVDLACKETNAHSFKSSR